MKRATIVNMSLSALREVRAQEGAGGERTGEGGGKRSQWREEVVMEDLLAFVKLVAEERGKARNREARGGREAGRTQGRPEREDPLPIPLPLCESAALLLRKYLLFRAEERPDGARGRPRLAHDRSNNLRALLRTNKENESQPAEQQEDEAAPFRSMAAQQWDRERLLARNQELEAEAGELRERLKEKNAVICKLLGKESQLRRKYNEELNRLLRNRNIYNISANFEREEEEGEGRNALNIAGRQLADSHPPAREDQERSQLPAGKALAKAESEYAKEGRPRLSKAKPKLHPCRPSKHAPFASAPPTQLLRTVNKSLPTECITRREDPASRLDAHDKLQEDPTFELYINQLEGTPLGKQPHLAQPRKSQAGRIRDEQFEVLQLHGFYNEETLKQIDAKLKI